MEIRGGEMGNGSELELCPAVWALQGCHGLFCGFKQGAELLHTDKLLDKLSVFDDEEGGDGEDLEAHGQASLVIHIDFSDLQAGIVQGFKIFVNDPSLHPAGTAPCGPEVHKPGSRAGGIVKVGSSQFFDLRHGVLSLG